jgi:hypothetical protein
MMKNNSRRWKKEEGAKVWEGMSHGMGGNVPWYGRAMVWEGRLQFGV